MSTKKDDIMVGCQCGKQWWVDLQPTPMTCVGDIWRLGTVAGEEGEGLYIEWGAWVDQDGNESYIRPSVWTEDMFAKVIIWLDDRLQDDYAIPEDVADCIAWCRENVRRNNG